MGPDYAPKCYIMQGIIIIIIFIKSEFYIIINDTCLCEDKIRSS